MSKGKVYYLPMCFAGTEWHTKQVLSENVLICGWATPETEKLCKKYYISARDSNTDEQNFKHDFYNIATKLDDEYGWFSYNTDQFDNKLVGKAWGSMWRFISINTNDFVYIKDEDEQKIHLARINDNSSLYCKKTKAYDYNAIFIKNVEYRKDIDLESFKREFIESAIEKKLGNRKQCEVKFKNYVSIKQGTCIRFFPNLPEWSNLFYSLITSYFAPEKETPSEHSQNLGNTTQGNTEDEEYNYTNANGRVINALNEMMRETKVRKAIPQDICNNVFQRAQKKYSKIRCENKECDNPQPFYKKDSKIYLEFHHIQEVSDGGQHEPKNLVLLCPNCHSEVHYGKHREKINNRLRDYAQTI